LPDFDIAAAEANTGSYVSVETGTDVVAAQLMGFLECLHKRIWVLVFGAVRVDGLAASAVYLDAGRTGCGEEM
jgi:hypothetical protein